MPQGTYNYFKKAGVVVENPRHAVRLEGSDQWFGGDLAGVTVEEAADYLITRTRGVGIGDLSAYYEANGRPDVILKARVQSDTEKQRFEWDETEGDYVPVDD